MKEFNLERALAGDPVVTRNRVAVQQIHYFSLAKDSHKVVAIIDGEIYSYFENGSFHKDNKDISDLFMAPVKKQEWVNIYAYGSGNPPKYGVGGSWASEEEAKREINEMRTYVTTVLIREWEE